ncbi:SH3 domain-containing protein [Aliagarivorans marinus]|uniref:SH3 domain-containing protein n=1 Tax=Aliagarivorans marinus TaxID=561965 RepID=UPI00047A3071|nr:SH3 domain-containing protein [Aliagarivorans marinus]
MHYKVMKNYSDNPSKPIRVLAGEELVVIEESNPEGDWPNWVLCKGTNKQGWVPKQLLRIVGSSATMLSDYHAIEHSLIVGETVVAQSELNGWVWAEKTAAPGQFAWAPINHLERLPTSHRG